jgi:hypothetical protein
MGHDYNENVFGVHIPSILHGVLIQSVQLIPHFLCRALEFPPPIVGRLCMWLLIYVGK